VSFSVVPIENCTAEMRRVNMRVHEGLDRYRYTPQYMGPGNERVRGSGPAMDVLMCRRNLELQRARQWGPTRSRGIGDDITSD
jgi:hypothetical protein